ncbi:hypothetical protein O3M35_000375 [Rhynocoris fuscipes]|uniref:C-CAP/cofactor C-like domain-containing protein n=1 Tax=Rhynocoris fuscipes TaxID=488301 RepID=A0AAW1DSH4_9HEMI
MVVKKIEMSDTLQRVINKTKQIRENFEKCYVRGNEIFNFKEQFMNKVNEIEQLFLTIEKEEDIKTVSKLLANIAQEIQTLEKLFSVSSMFVTQKVHGMCDELIWSLEDRLTLLRNIHLANKRAKEAEKQPPHKPTTNNNNNVINTNNTNKNNSNSIQNNTNTNNKVITNNVVQPKVLNATKYITKTEVKSLKQANFLNEKVYTLENLNGVALGLTEKVINSKRVLLSGLVSCSVKIGSCLESLQVLYCKYCKILVGQVATSLIKNTYNSLISINGDNIRIEYCESTIFKLPVKSNAIVKECYNLEFEPYEMDFAKKKESPTSSGTEQLVDQVEESQKHKLDEEERQKDPVVGQQLTECTESLGALNQSYEFVKGGKASD